MSLKPRIDGPFSVISILEIEARSRSILHDDPISVPIVQAIAALIGET